MTKLLKKYVKHEKHGKIWEYVRVFVTHRKIKLKNLLNLY